LTLAKIGVTGFLATTVVTEDKEQKHLKVISDIIKEQMPGSKILGIHLEGLFINIKKKAKIIKNERP